MGLSAPIRITHVISSLSMGGAEMILYRLVSNLDPDVFESEVISLTGDQPVGGMIRSLGIPVTAMGFRPGVPDPGMIRDLARIFRSRKPNIIQSWMYHANLLGGLAAGFAGSPPVVWGIHHAVAERKALKPATSTVAHVNAFLSWSLPKKIVCCAEAARVTHIRMGYCPAKMTVIPNGFDTMLFHPDVSACKEVRHELGLDEGMLLVGLCARFHPDKDHRTFLQAAKLIHAIMPEVHFILWGNGVDLGNETLEGWIREAGLVDCMHLLGQRLDTNRLLAALDIFALSSFTEAFPSVIGEAMACGVPCVATDTGDSRLVIGDTGKIVPKCNPEALATGILDLLSRPDERSQLGIKARQRVIEQYSLEKMALAYAGLYQDIIAGGKR